MTLLEAQLTLILTPDHPGAVSKDSPQGQKPGEQLRPTCSLIWHMARFWSSQEQATRIYLSQLPAPA